MPYFIHLYLDACRWWAFGGAFLGIPPLIKVLHCLFLERTQRALYTTPPLSRIHMEKSGLFLSLIATLIGGAFLPLSTRVSWMAAESVIYDSVMIFAWTLWAFSVWSIAFAFARSKIIMLASSCIWGIAVWAAVISTGGM